MKCANCETDVPDTVHTMYDGLPQRSAVEFCPICGHKVSDE